MRKQANKCTSGPHIKLPLTNIHGYTLQVHISAFITSALMIFLHFNINASLL